MRTRVAVALLLLVALAGWCVSWLVNAPTASTAPPRSGSLSLPADTRGAAPIREADARPVSDECTPEPDATPAVQEASPQTLPVEPLDESPRRELVVFVCDVAGQPIAGAHVSSDVGDAVTDDTGRVAITLPPTAGQRLFGAIHVQCDGYLPTDSYCPCEPFAYTVVLQAACHVRGRVFTVDGEPARATVWLDSDRQCRTHTVEDGSFELIAPPGPALLRIRSARHLLYTSPRPFELKIGQPLELHDIRLAQCRIRILDPDGTAAAEREVTVWSGDVESDTTDADGWYNLGNASIPEFRVRVATRDGTTMGPWLFRAPACGSGMRVCHTLRLPSRDEMGAVTVELGQDDLDAVCALSLANETPGGFITWLSPLRDPPNTLYAPPGRYRIFAFFPENGSGWRSEPFDLVAGNRVSLPVDLNRTNLDATYPDAAPDDSRTLQCTVRLPDGRLLDDALVACCGLWSAGPPYPTPEGEWNENLRSYRSCRVTAENATFEIDYAKPMFVAVSPGTQRVRCWAFRLPDPSHLKDGSHIELRIPDDADFGELRGTIVDDAGKPVVAAKIELRTADTDVVQAVVAANRASDVHGRFAFGSLPPGPYNLTITRPGFASARQLIVLPTAGRESCTVNLKPAGFVQVQLEGDYHCTIICSLHGREVARLRRTVCN